MIPDQASTFPEPHEPPLAPEVARATGLRSGWTTGTCASAAAKAAVIWLLSGSPPATVEVAIPGGRRVSFQVSDIDESCPYRVAVVKDAGDDPDVTDRAHVTAAAAWNDDEQDRRCDEVEGGKIPPAVVILAGEGVGVVTLPGLGIEVGQPAVTAVPRRMITAAVTEVTDRPVRIVLSVPGGADMAAKTSNQRLGILGGISILGTTGIVRPFSTAAWRASVVQQVDVATAQGSEHIVLSTGGRSDAAAQRLFPELAPVCFVEVGDFTGIALRRAVTAGARRVSFVGMAGKITKLAAGVLMTHYRRSKIDGDLLASVAKATSAPPSVVEAATATATARHFAEICLQAGATAALDELCRMAAQSCIDYTAGALGVEVIMVDFEGAEVIAHG